jgi:hypothetical protein
MLLHGLRRELRRGRVRQPTEQGRAERLRMSPRDGGGETGLGEPAADWTCRRETLCAKVLPFFPSKCRF